MDEYEVKVHALEDMEEGEVTSDEEGEIKGQLLVARGYGTEGEGCMGRSKVSS